MFRPLNPLEGRPQAAPISGSPCSFGPFSPGSLVAFVAFLIIVVVHLPNAVPLRFVLVLI